MKCRDCQFYQETYPKEKSGLCNIQMPPWIELGDPKFRANMVDAKEGCDLGKPKEDDDEL
jgi:hypothetical protein